MLLSFNSAGLKKYKEKKGIGEPVGGGKQRSLSTRYYLLKKELLRRMIATSTTNLRSNSPTIPGEKNYVIEKGKSKAFYNVQGEMELQYLTGGGCSEEANEGQDGNLSLACASST